MCHGQGTVAMSLLTFRGKETSLGTEHSKYGHISLLSREHGHFSLLRHEHGHFSLRRHECDGIPLLRHKYGHFCLLRRQHAYLSVRRPSAVNSLCSSTATSRCLDLCTITSLLRCWHGNFSLLTHPFSVTFGLCLQGAIFLA